MTGLKLNSDEQPDYCLKIWTKKTLTSFYEKNEYEA